MGDGMTSRDFRRPGWGSDSIFAMNRWFAPPANFQCPFGTTPLLRLRTPGYFPTRTLEMRCVLVGLGTKTSLDRYLLVGRRLSHFSLVTRHLSPFTLPRCSDPPSGSPSWSCCSEWSICASHGSSKLRSFFCGGS